MMLNWNEISVTTPKALTIIGMAKNVGKTVTLNYIQKVLHSQGIALGLTSIGRDGESFDALTHLAKPSIVVQPQTIVATAEKVSIDPNRWDYLQKTDIWTPLGNVLILKAKFVNQVVLAGPSRNEDVRQLLQCLTRWGTRCTLVDGAFDRQSSADPLISGQIVLATGATLSRDIEELLRITACRVEQLTIPNCNKDYAKRYNQSSAKVLVNRHSQWQEYFVKTSLLSSAEWLTVLKDDCTALIIRGAVGDGIAQALLKKQQIPTVVVQDGSKIFITVDLWRQLKARNIQIQALQPISLLGVTINPVYPGGKGIDPGVLLQKMGAALAPIPVMDVVQEIKF
ncbi:lysine 5,6-aminomutase reactivase subunit KamB [Pelosinus propionicus]|nr:hypothetical protein [Pelosinus propionicus]